MANSNGWGDGAANNSIGWGQGANNAIAWGDSHAKSWAGATDIVGFDSSAISYFNATGITGATQQTAIDNLVKGLKQDGLWSKMKAVYPFVTDNRNLLGYTENFGNSYWDLGTPAIKTPNYATAPDGTMTACRVYNGGYIQSQGISKQIGTYVFSLYVKMTSGTSGTIRLFVDGGATRTIVNVTNTWTRVQVNQTFALTDTSTIGFFVDSDVLIWHPQLELGSTATTYQPIATTQQAFISNQFKYNLVNPVDSDAAFRLVFNGGWTHSANGALPNGVNSYADTKLNPTIALTNYNAHSSTYNRTNSDNVGWEIGLTQSVGVYANEFLLAGRKTGFSVSGLYDFGNPNGEVKFASSSAVGFFQNSITSNTSHKLYKNGVQIGVNTNTNNSTPANGNIYLSAVNDINTTAIAFSIVQQSFVSIGDGLTDTEAANLYTAVQAFQTSLSRQV